MKPEQLTRLMSLSDRLIEASLIDADPGNWTANGLKPMEMSKEERGDAKWCRSLAVSTVALAMQVQRLLHRPLMGDAFMGGNLNQFDGMDEEETVESEISRYEQAAAKVLSKARRGNAES